jgi:hypothetical protein
MVLDKEEHRTLLLELVNGATFHGRAARLVVELVEAIEQSTVSGEVQITSTMRRSFDKHVAEAHTLGR